MRNYFPFLLIMIISFQWNIGKAQTKVMIGIKAGVSVPNLTSGNNENPVSNGYGSRLDADFAIHGEFPITGHFSIQPQLEYSSQGGKKNGIQAFSVPDDLQQLFPSGQVPAFLFANYKSEARINYLILPVLAKFHFDLKKHWGAYIAAGPFAGLLLSAKNITKGESNIYLDENATQPVTSEPQSFDKKEEIKGDLRKFNTGISGHIGVGYKLVHGLIFLEAGGNFGFIDIQKNQADGKNKTGAAAITAGYQFQL